MSAGRAVAALLMLCLLLLASMLSSGTARSLLNGRPHQHHQHNGVERVGVESWLLYLCAVCYMVVYIV